VIVESAESDVLFLNTLAPIWSIHTFPKIWLSSISSTIYCIAGFFEDKNFHELAFRRFSRGKFSWIIFDSWNSWKFSPSKITCYTVIYCMHEKSKGRKVCDFISWKHYAWRENLWRIFINMQWNAECFIVKLLGLL